MNGACPPLRASFAFALGVFTAALTMASVQARPATDTAAFDRLFDDTFARYQLPGLAVGVVEAGEVVYLRTAGERVAGSGEAITPDTLFKIASNSKAMTTAVLARLVDAGTLRWDDPVSKYLPDFRMHDPWVTRQLQVRDLLIHNSGLGAGAGDLMLWPEPNMFTRADLLAGLAYLKPAYSFRSRYAYDNVLYIVAGEVAAAAAGASYEDLVRRELFEPLGMTRCQVGEWERDAVGNVAQPHMRIGGRNVVIRADGPDVPLSTSAAAGGIRCSLYDMLTWTRALLAPAQTSPWLSPAQRKALWTAHMPMPVSQRMRDWDNTHFSAYGYGWRLSDVDGQWKVAHTGTLAGMYSSLTLLPDQETGFVILINGDADEARTVLGQALVKHYTAPAQARDVAYYADALARERQTESVDRTRPSVADTSSRQPQTKTGFEPWLGVYQDAWFGRVALCPTATGVEFRAGKSPLLVGRVMRVDARWLVDWHDDSVDAEPWLSFTRAAPDTPVTMRMAAIDPDADFSYDYADLAFTRVADCE